MCVCSRMLGACVWWCGCVRETGGVIVHASNQCNEGDHLHVQHVK